MDVSGHPGLGESWQSTVCLGVGFTHDLRIHQQHHVAMVFRWIIRLVGLQGRQGGALQVRRQVLEAVAAVHDKLQKRVTLVLNKLLSRQDDTVSDLVARRRLPLHDK